MFDPIDTAGDATIVEGIIAEGQVQERDGDRNLNLEQYEGRGVVIAFLPEGDDGSGITADAAYDVTLDADAGTFTLDVDVDGGGAATTAAIAFDALPAAVKAAIVALANVGANDVEVTGAAGAFTVTFGGALAGVPVVLTADDANLDLGAGAGTATVTETSTAAAAGAEARYRFAAAELAGEFPAVP